MTTRKTRGVRRNVKVRPVPPDYRERCRKEMGDLVKSQLDAISQFFLLKQFNELGPEMRQFVVLMWNWKHAGMGVTLTALAEPSTAPAQHGPNKEDAAV